MEGHKLNHNLASLEIGLPNFLRLFFLYAPPLFYHSFPYKSIYFSLLHNFICYRISKVFSTKINWIRIFLIFSYFDHYLIVSNSPFSFIFSFFVISPLISIIFFIKFCAPQQKMRGQVPLFPQFRRNYTPLHLRSKWRHS